MLVASTPETTNPVATTCEAEGMPCISTMAPWQPWFIGQQGNPGDPASWKPFNYAYHYFWGLEDVIAVFTNMWNAARDQQARSAGCSPTTATATPGATRMSASRRCSTQQGYTLTDPGRYQNLTDDFSAQINAFKAANAEIVTGVVIPPDFTTFWNQASSRASSRRRVTVGKAILFPQSVEALGDAGQQPVVRSLVVAEPSVQVVADRPERGRPRGRLHRRRPGGPGRSRSASSIRCSRWRPT